MRRGQALAMRHAAPQMRVRCASLTLKPNACTPRHARHTVSAYACNSVPRSHAHADAPCATEHHRIAWTSYTHEDNECGASPAYRVDGAHHVLLRRRRQLPHRDHRALHPHVHNHHQADHCGHVLCEIKAGIIASARLERGATFIRERSFIQHCRCVACKV